MRGSATWACAELRMAAYAKAGMMACYPPDIFDVAHVSGCHPADMTTAMGNIK
jgi:hypothetical protein